jgi:hypothetical protein
MRRNLAEPRIVCGSVVAAPMFAKQHPAGFEARTWMSVMQCLMLAMKKPPERGDLVSTPDARLRWMMPPAGLPHGIETGEPNASSNPESGSSPRKAIRLSASDGEMMLIFHA